MKYELRIKHTSDKSESVWDVFSTLKGAKSVLRIKSLEYKAYGFNVENDTNIKNRVNVYHPFGRYLLSMYIVKRK